MASIARSLLLASAVLLGVAGCTPQTTQTPAAPQPAKPAAEAGPEELWEELAEAARSEGRVIIATFSPELRDRLGPAFTERFGVDAEFMIARGPEHVARIETERAAGIYSTDIVMTGVTQIGAVMLPGGWLTRSSR